MGLSCCAYRLYDWAKQRKVVAWLLYAQPYEHFWPLTIVGIVTAKYQNRGDGDRCFDVRIEAATPKLADAWHCEVTPCATKELKQIVLGLKVGQRVKVSGVRTYDGNHRILWKKFKGGGGNFWEIHPCTSIEIL